MNIDGSDGASWYHDVPKVLLPQVTRWWRFCSEACYDKSLPQQRALMDLQSCGIRRHGLEGWAICHELPTLGGAVLTTISWDTIAANLTIMGYGFPFMTSTEAPTMLQNEIMYTRHGSLLLGFKKVFETLQGYHDFFCEH